MCLLQTSQGIRQPQADYLKQNAVYMNVSYVGHLHPRDHLGICAYPFEGKERINVRFHLVCSCICPCGCCCFTCAREEAFRRGVTRRINILGAVNVSNNTCRDPRVVVAKKTHNIQFSVGFIR